MIISSGLMTKLHPYNTTPPSFVKPSGPKKSPIMIVGEAPTQSEGKNGQGAFSGKHSYVLSNCFSGKTVEFENCYRTYVFKDTVYSLSEYYKTDDRKKTVQINEKGKAYIEILKREIEEVNPQFIIAVGEAAWACLTNRRGITKWRGSIVDSTLSPGRLVGGLLSTYYIIRGNPEYQSVCFMDISKFIKTWRSGQGLLERNLIIQPSYSEIHDYLDYCISEASRGAGLGTDIETKHNQMHCFSIASNEREAMCIPLAMGKKHIFSAQQEASILQKYLKILADPNIFKIIQNKMYEMQFLFRKYGVLIRDCADTMVAQQIICHELPKGLDFLTSLYTDVPYYKDDGKEWIKGNSNRYDQLWRYSCLDSVVLPEIWRKQYSILQKRGLAA